MNGLTFASGESDRTDSEVCMVVILGQTRFICLLLTM